jgi:hypothetical protein
VAGAGRVDDEYRAKGRSVAGGLREEVTFYVVDNDGVGPTEKLADSKEAFAAPGRGDNQKIAKLRAGLHGAHPQNVIEVAYPKKKACVPLGTRLEKVFKLVNAGEAGVVEFMLSGKKDGKFAENDE